MIITGKYPNLRMRRSRKANWSRRLISENNLSVNDLVLPIFVIEGKNKKIPINSMPGVYRYTIDRLKQIVDKAISLKIPMVAIFPYVNRSLKNNLGSESLNKNNLDEYDVKNKTQKKRMAYALAKHYVKIAHIYAAIASTIDPEYVYTDENGEKKFFNLKDFHSYKQIDKSSNELRLHRLDNPMGLVRKRLTILKNKLDDNDDNEYIVMNPGESFCSLKSEDSNLKNEIGIKELDALYFDVYDDETNKWNKRSVSMEKSYDFNVWSDVTPKQLRQFSLIISKLVMLHNWENIPCTQDNLRKAKV